MHVTPLPLAILMILPLAGLIPDTAMPMPGSADPVGTEHISSSFSGVTSAEFEAAVRSAMPLPVLRIMHWGELGRHRFAIEMSLAGIPNAPQPAMHVTFHTPATADRALLLEAIHAAGDETRALMARLRLLAR